MWWLKYLPIVDDERAHSLEHASQKPVIHAEGGELVPQDSLHHFSEAVAVAADRFGATEISQPRTGVADQEQVDDEAASAASTRPDSQFLTSYGIARLLDERGDMRSFGALEREVIRFAIEHYRGHMSEVARRLGIGRSTLYRKVKDYGIAPGEPVAS